MRFVVDKLPLDRELPPHLDFLPLVLFQPVFFATDAVSQQMTALLISFVHLFCSLL
jgi:hypothetical protein